MDLEENFDCERDDVDEAYATAIGSTDNPQDVANERIFGDGSRGSPPRPFQVIIVNQRGKRICSGTLLSRRHVLTAAHCMITTSANSQGKEVQPVLEQWDIPIDVVQCRI